jgi:antirestriction protein ArdC
LWLSRDRGWTTPRFLTFKQAIEAGGSVRKGEHGTKVYFVKQLRMKDGDEADTRLVPMLREYTVFNVDQCDGLPDSIRSTSSPCVQANTSARFPSAQRYSAVARGMCRLQLVRWIIYD